MSTETVLARTYTHRPAYVPLASNRAKNALCTETGASNGAHSIVAIKHFSNHVRNIML